MSEKELNRALEEWIVYQHEKTDGKLLGLVRADNIRFIHFPEILRLQSLRKTINIKKFGEGVNCMCNELE